MSNKNQKMLEEIQSLTRDAVRWDRDTHKFEGIKCIPTAFLSEKGEVMISADDSTGFAVYYGAGIDGLPDIDPQIEAIAEKYGHYPSWDNWKDSGVLVLKA